MERRIFMSDWKEKLKTRTHQAAVNKDSRGLGRKSILDLGMIKLPVWTPRSGRDKNYIDIMPWQVTQSWYKNLHTRTGVVTGLDPGDCDYKLEVARHGNVGPGKDMMLCLREAWGKSDPICEDMFAEFQKRKDGSREFDEKKARSFQPSWRDFYIVWDYDQPEKGFQLWEHSYELFEKYLLDELKTAIDEGGMIIPWDLQDGRSVEFKGREKKLGSTPFIEAEGITFHKRDPYDDSVISKLPSLDSTLIIPTYEEIRVAHYGLEEGDDKGIEQPEASPSVEQEAHRGRTRPGTESSPPTEVSKGVRTRGEKEVAPLKSDGCPAGGKLGEDCGKIQACKDEACDQAVYEACLKRHEELSKEAEAEKQKASKEPEKSARTRRR
jgi:hypothetical protein